MILLAIKTFILFNNTSLCIWGDLFGLIGKFFKISIFNILTGQKRDMTELKLVWPVNMTGHCSKIILSPGIDRHSTTNVFSTHDMKNLKGEKITKLSNYATMILWKLMIVSCFHFTASILADTVHNIQCNSHTSACLKLSPLETYIPDAFISIANISAAPKVNTLMIWSWKWS